MHKQNGLTKLINLKFETNFFCNQYFYIQRAQIKMKYNITIYSLPKVTFDPKLILFEDAVLKVYRI